LAEVGFLVGQRALRFVHRAGLDQKLFLGRTKLLAQVLVPRLKSENGCGLFSEFHLQTIDGVALLAEFGKLGRASGLEFLDAHFQSTRRHGELGAKLILVRLNFRHRQRRGCLEPTHCQPHGARMDERNDNDPDQSRDKKANAEKHDRLNHGPRASNLSALAENRGITPTDLDGGGAYPKRGPASRYKKVQASESKILVNEVRSERIPGRLRGKLEVADIGS